MTQFRIDVVVDPRKGVAGVKRVERGLTDLEKRANRTQLLLQRAFALITVSAAVRQLAILGDSFTNLQNRLRVVTDGEQELVRVTEQLLNVANRSRSSFTGTAELYSRLALATRELNLEGANLIEITESINKAIILSGASAKEANNGLIQLSQGLASGRLTGDELRSTLEQLPVVADVIAKRLGVTRGELRKLGAEGKITSIEIIKAFQDSQQEIEENFAKTIPTLSQSFVVLKNNVIAFVGELNEGTGVLRGLGSAMRFLGESIDGLIKSLGVLGATILAIKFAPFVQGVVDLNKAVKAGTAVRLGSAAAINMQNVALAANAAANVVAQQAEVQRLKDVIFATRQELIHDSAIVGKNASILALGATEQRLIPVRAQLAAATNALAAAEQRSAAASTVAATRVTFLSQASTKARAAVSSLTAAIAANPVGAFVVGLTAAVSGLVFFRNEIKLTEDGVGTLNDLFAEFFDQLNSALSVIGGAFSDAFGPAFDAVADFVSKFNVQFQDLLLVPAAILDALIAIFVATFNTIVSVFLDLPKALGQAFVVSVNAIIDTIEFIPDVVIGVVKTVATIIGQLVDGIITAADFMAQALEAIFDLDFAKAAELGDRAGAEISKAFEFATDDLGGKFLNNIADELDSDFIPRLDNVFEGSFDELGRNSAAAFLGGIESSPVLDFVQGLLAGAEQRGQDQQAAAATAAKAEADKAAAVAAAERAEAITKLIDPLQREAFLLGVLSENGQREADIQRTLLDLKAKATKAGLDLSASELAAGEALVRRNAALKEQVALQQRLIPIQDQLAERTRIANEAEKAGVITKAQLAEELRNIELAAAAAGDSIGDGLTRAYAAAVEGANDLASVTEDVLAASFSAAENALVEFTNTGKFSFKDFASSLIKDISRIIIKLLILKAIEALGGGGIGSALSSSGSGRGGGFQGPEQRADGGLAAANKPFLVGEEGPEIFTPGQTGSVTPTDQTIEALRGGAGGRGETMIIQAPAPEVNLKTVVVDDPSLIPQAIEGPDGTQSVLNVINKNQSAINRRG